MSDDKKDFDNLFSGIQFLGGLFKVNSILGCIFTALILAVWIWYAIKKQQWKWQDALNKAADSLKAVANESVQHNDNTSSGDEWENGKNNTGKK